MKFHRPLLVAVLATFGSAISPAVAQNTEAQNKALEALRQAQSGSTTTAAFAPATVADSDAQRQAVEALRRSQGGAGLTPSTATYQSSAAGTPAVGAETPAQRQALEALRGQQTLVAKPAVIPDEATPAQRRAMEAMNSLRAAGKGETVAAPVPVAAAPETPKGPPTKQDKLAELTRRYRADEITPQEYHAERAKIVAQP